LDLHHKGQGLSLTIEERFDENIHYSGGSSFFPQKVPTVT